MIISSVSMPIRSLSVRVVPKTAKGDSIERKEIGPANIPIDKNFSINYSIKPLFIYFFFVKSNPKFLIKKLNHPINYRLHNNNKMFKFAFAIAAFFVGAIAASDECPVDKEVKCIDEFKEALPYCKKASESKGSDKDADLNCVKYAYQMEK